MTTDTAGRENANSHTDTLEGALEQLEHDDGYHRVGVLRESASQLTELVERDGKHFVRKSFRIPNDLARMAELEHLFHELMRVSSPHLAKTVDCYRLGDTLVVLSEYVYGITLRAGVQKNGTVGHKRARELMCDLCDAAEALHGGTGETLVHRDITPDNVIITRTGAVLTDLGAVRRYDASKKADTQMVGTAGYAAPEQYGFEQTTPASDVYALGMVYLFMLTGEDPGAALAASLKDDTRVYPAERAIIERCTQLDPSNRYRTTALLAISLKSSGRNDKAQLFLAKHDRVLHPVLLIVGSLIYWPVALIGFTYPWMGVEVWTLRTTIQMWAFVLFVLTPPYILISNPGHLLQRTHFLEIHPIRHIVETLVLCFLLLLIAAFISR